MNLSSIKKAILYAFLLLLSLQVFAQEVSPVFTVYLIGDTGKDTVMSPGIKLLKSEITKHPNSTVVFLGDNVYPNGLSIDSRHPEIITLQQKKMIAQLDIFKNYPGKVFMVPGNHDWNKEKWSGKQQIKDEAIFVENYLQAHSKLSNGPQGVFFPKDAGPGPVSIFLKDSLRLILFDTQWWLQQQFFHPVGKEEGKSKRATKKRFYLELDSLLANAKTNHEKVIIGAHHPLFTNGRHNAKRQPWRFLINYTPLQILGIFGLNRMLMQDVPQPRYGRMVKDLLRIIDKYDNITYASGHDHNLQFSKHKKMYHVVSGAGSMHSNKIKDDECTLYICKGQSGFFKLSYYPGGRVLVEVLGTYNGEVVHSSWMQ